MTDFKAKMHQIRFRLGSAPDPAGGAYSAPQTPQLDLRGLLLSEGTGGKGEGTRGEEKRGKGREEKGGERRPFW